MNSQNKKSLRSRGKLSYRMVLEKRSGIVLVIVLWVLVILSALAIGLGRKTNIELALAKNAIGKTRAKFLSWAGVVYAIDHIIKDTKDKVSSKNDTFYYCGIQNSEDFSPEQIFSQREVGDGYFDIAYSQQDSGGMEGSLGESGQKKRYFGLSDEERKINLNGLTRQNYKILGELIVYLGYDEEVAETISASVVDWTDGDDNITGEDKGAENEYYESLPRPYLCKNIYFDSKEELLLVRGMTKEIYYAIEDYVTIFPQGANLLINFDTAAEPVLYALARMVSQLSPSTDINDADSLIEKMLIYQQGDDGIAHTADDNVIDHQELGLNALERNIFLAMSRYRTKVSRFLNVQVTGVDEVMGARSHVEAIVAREEYSILSWRRD